MKLKVCGITTLAQLQQVQDLGFDYAGLIFYEKSKRFAHEKLKNVQAEIQKSSIKKVGVFVNADMRFLESLIIQYGLNAVQLHGDESPEYGTQLMPHVDVIKVFRINAATRNIDALVAPYASSCQYYLFDTDTASYGGSGTRFDWTILEQAAINKPFFLSGGIGPEAVVSIKNFSHPMLYAVDVNSRFESSPGVKDMDVLKSFKTALQQPHYG